MPKDDPPLSLLHTLTGSSFFISLSSFTAHPLFTCFVNSDLVELVALSPFIHLLYPSLCIFLPLNQLVWLKMCGCLDIFSNPPCSNSSTLAYIWYSSFGYILTSYFMLLSVFWRCIRALQIYQFKCIQSAGSCIMQVDNANIITGYAEICRVGSLSPNIT